MHRSGTSLAASALRQAGLQLGSRLNGPGPGNPRGHFEDLDVWRLPEEMLAAAGETAFSAGDDFQAPRGDGFERRAAALVAARAGQRAWGWKDPRTSLFLDFWEPLVPRASYLILYRHPVDVVLSLLRRNTQPELREEPRLAFRAWTVHNRRLLALLDRHRERCFVAQAPAFGADLEGLVRRVGEYFGLPLDAAGVRSLFAPEELAASLPAAQRPPWERVVPEALELYQELEDVADLRGTPEAPAAAAADEEDAVDDAASPRARPEMRLSEHLLYDVLEQRTLRRQQRTAAEAFAAALEEKRGELAGTQDKLTAEHARSTELERRLAAEHARAERLERRLGEMAAHRDQLGSTLATIERSRSFALLAGWWRLAGRVRGLVRPSAPG
jgi:hypothetical protein